ncbi:MAG: methionine biosynthesis protein MetW [Patescibacteria group bacterium]|jgi:methionine biosynthesis protein MetW
MNDNRNYKFALESNSFRDEYPTIVDWIPQGSKVIDLGCGDGSLLAELKKKGVSGEGVEIAESGVEAAKKKGIRAKVGRIDAKMPYKNKQFDYAICNVTLQMVMYPEVLMSEMKRIAKRQIVSFPNFAFLPNRLDMLLNGRMPQVMIPYYQWYSTGHIHQFSIRDYEEFCRKSSLRIVDKKFLGPKRILRFPTKLLHSFPNAWASIAIYLTENK